jgi:hypothetical protein
MNVARCCEKNAFFLDQEARGKVTTGKEDVNTEYGASIQFFQRLQSGIQDGAGALESTIIIGENATQ